MAGSGLGDSGSAASPHRPNIDVANSDREEFVAHASDVNCVKFGRKTSRILITGGEDQKSLSGLTSPVESVSFDSSEAMIGAGASSGTIKIWDVDEAKVVRTFTGHRSSCASLDFHPFGEFFASGSSDTNMKIWDMRKKGCIHTYKGHTRRIDVLRFTPDGRWIVSGGSDNSVKIWDLTAGKLLHDFRNHEGPINCLDFHPHEFLLATGSADKTVKFWDLETFELIGSSGPEASVVRSMTFNKDGKSLFCGLHESLKVLSWEPIICHDVVDVGWSTLGDLIVHEGKLLGCSYNQSCAGIWVVDLMKIEPYAVSIAEAHLNESVNRSIQADNSISSVLGRLSVSRSPAKEASSDTLLKLSMSASKEVPVPASSAVTKKLPKEPITSNIRLTRSDSLPVVSPRVRLNPKFSDDQKRQTDYAVPITTPRIRSKVDLSIGARAFHRNSVPSVAPTNRSRSKISAYSSEGSSFIPVVVPRHIPKVDSGPNLSKVLTTDLTIVEPQDIERGGLAVDCGEDDKLVCVIDSRSSNMGVQNGRRRKAGDIITHKETPETALTVNMDRDFRRKAPETESMQQDIFHSEPISSKCKYIKETSGAGDINLSGSAITESVKSNEGGDWYNASSFVKPNLTVGRNPETSYINRRTMFGLRHSTDSSEKHAVEHGPSNLSASYERNQYAPTLHNLRRRSSVAREQSASAGDEDDIADLMENHQEFIHAVKSRLTKLEVITSMVIYSICYFEIPRVTVTADIISVLMENDNSITLDICTCVLPLASSVLEKSSYDRHLKVALEMILKLVKSFGSTISSAVSSTPPVGVDIEAEQRLNRCNLCFLELIKVHSVLFALTRRQGEVGRSAQELSLFLQDIFQLTSR
uniref:Katanin p80 WD40 repeat-containing subunit B1 homolog n=1 Tax=Oryza sativa subsp. japonica TaxID=39947 RepID=Q8LNT7_ORYSJ|nr:putative microtubule-severing protein subunit [Oryza sativa Japonica Group]